MADGRQIADYRAHAEVHAMASTQGGASIVLGVVDGSLTVLTIADPKNEANQDFLSSLPSRQTDFNPDSPNISPARKTITNGALNFGAVMQVARVTARAKMAQKSRACVISWILLRRAHGSMTTQKKT